MKTMAAGFFKVHCLAVMNEVRARREIVLITKRGKPVAKVVPVSEDEDEIYGFLAGKGSIAGNVVSPALALEEWGAVK
jgi:prevent-host-death family protein